MLTGDSETEEAEQIDSAPDELESGKLRAQLKEMADVWARSDADKLARYSEWCDCVRTPAEQRLMKRLLDDRNPGLADGIERLHTSGKGVFAAVGALHMVGPQGLPTLMAARGFVVAPVLTDGSAGGAADTGCARRPSRPTQGRARGARTSPRGSNHRARRLRKRERLEGRASPRGGARKRACQVRRPQQHQRARSGT
jgi:hypothetical protein